MTEALKCAVVHVLIPRPFHQPFTYRVEQGKIDFPLIQGDWVLVPLGKREQVIGCVWSTEVEYDGELDRLKEVTLAVSWLPRLPHSLLQLITTLSHYYHVPIGEASLYQVYYLRRFFLFKTSSLVRSTYLLHFGRASNVWEHWVLFIMVNFPFIYPKENGQPCFRRRDYVSLSSLVR